MKSSEDLRELLRRIDRRSYPAYKDIKGSYAFGDYVLSIDHVQGDPFASPSKISLHIFGKYAGFPDSLYAVKPRRIALQDELLRQFGRCVQDLAFKAKGSGKSGLLSVSRCSQEILERTGCEIDPEKGDVLLRMEVGLPANGRTINAREADKIFFEFIPSCMAGSLYYKVLNQKRLQAVSNLADDQTYIREKLKEMGLCAFVADGAILPRESGISQKPLKGAVPFKSPESMEVIMNLPHRGRLRGMGIPKGITLIVGGGYHGKSTLLEALERGVYNHIEGDGREYVITEDTAMKIRAEDGRSIKGVDISMFIDDLPGGKETKNFKTANASGSTSQAANVIEAVEAGSQTLLIDEDTSATNFMIRDELMQLVVSRDSEPITPYIDRIQELYNRFNISTILVAGSSGSYFHKADYILQMKNYIPEDITEFAKKKAAEFPALPADALPVKPLDFKRIPKSAGTLGERSKLKVLGRDAIQIDREIIELRYVEQLVDSEQLMSLACMIKYLSKYLINGRDSLTELVDVLIKHIEKNGLKAIYEKNYLPSGLAMPRRQEIFACLNRYRKINL